MSGLSLGTSGTLRWNKIDSEQWILHMQLLPDPNMDSTMAAFRFGGPPGSADVTIFSRAPCLVSKRAPPTDDPYITDPNSQHMHTSYYCYPLL